MVFISLDPGHMSQNGVSDQGLHYLLIGIYTKNTKNVKNIHQKPLKLKRTHSKDKDGQIH